MFLFFILLCFIFFYFYVFFLKLIPRPRPRRFTDTQVNQGITKVTKSFFVEVNGLLRAKSKSCNVAECLFECLESEWYNKLHGWLPTFTEIVFTYFMTKWMVATATSRFCGSSKTSSAHSFYFVSIRIITGEMFNRNSFLSWKSVTVIDGWVIDSKWLMSFRLFHTLYHVIWPSFSMGLPAYVFSVCNLKIKKAPSDSRCDFSKRIWSETTKHLFGDCALAQRSDYRFFLVVVVVPCFL